MQDGVITVFELKSLVTSSVAFNMTNVAASVPLSKVVFRLGDK